MNFQNFSMKPSSTSSHFSVPVVCFEQFQLLFLYLKKFHETMVFKSTLLTIFSFLVSNFLPSLFSLFPENFTSFQKNCFLIKSFTFAKLYRNLLYNLQITKFQINNHLVARRWANSDVYEKAASSYVMIRQLLYREWSNAISLV